MREQSQQLCMLWCWRSAFHCGQDGRSVTHRRVYCCVALNERSLNTPWWVGRVRGGTRLPTGDDSRRYEPRLALCTNFPAEAQMVKHREQHVPEICLWLHMQAQFTRSSPPTGNSFWVLRFIWSLKTGLRCDSVQGGERSSSSVTGGGGKISHKAQGLRAQMGRTCQYSRLSTVSRVMPVFTQLLISNHHRRLS